MSMIQFSNGMVFPEASVEYVKPTFLYVEIPQFIEPQSSDQEAIVRSRRAVQISYFLRLKNKGAKAPEPIRLHKVTVDLSEEVVALENSVVWATMDKDDKAEISKRLVGMKNFLKQKEASPSAPKLAANGGTTIPEATPAENKMLDEELQLKYNKRLRFCQKKVSNLMLQEEFDDLQSLIRSLQGDDNSAAAQDIETVQAAVTDMGQSVILGTY